MVELQFVKLYAWGRTNKLQCIGRPNSSLVTSTAEWLANTYEPKDLLIPCSIAVSLKLEEKADTTETPGAKDALVSGVLMMHKFIISTAGSSR